MRQRNIRYESTVYLIIFLKIRKSAPFQGIVLALVFAYLVIIYHNLREVYMETSHNPR